VDAHHLFHRHREGVERVVVAQILLGGVGEARQIAQLFEIVGVYAGLVEFALDLLSWLASGVRHAQ
jgi:hypothetical protein